MEERFGPPGINANHKGGMALHMVIECLLINNSATGYIYQNGIWLHPGKLLFPYEPFGGFGEWQRDHHHVAGTQHVFYIAQRTNEFRWLATCSTVIDRIDFHVKSTHESGSGTPDSPKAKDASRRAREQTVRCKLIKFAVPQFLVFNKQPFRQCQCHSHHVFSHGSSIRPRVACDDDM